ncbi:uncharacterized protein I303_100360 [Kwoniella dejecticola CBS 10117]|uniref:Aldose 1-epimerase n=1 Tax=Kwoniella dejecticola CBS 10117 TaxID=1296121 RepID=A0A1A6AEU1_9TREE|nr:uncharacterized protein I303_00360 [Kwoniella dejecticola CBS 10117]OBR88543.1 hypothetical protein I303_00360 [Kwoniella dejecticola CBS 10117]
MSSRKFGQHDGKDVLAVDIQSPDGSTTATIITFGAAIHDLSVPTPTGPRSVILGFDDLSGYVDNKQWHHGAVAGRVANRIAHGRFALDSTDYTIEVNEPTGHTCHGGISGFGHKNWTLQKHTKHSVTLEYASPDGDQGFPGNLKASITYSIPSSGVFRLDYTAQTDKKTPVNLTNHSFFNVDGARGPSVHDNLQQKLTIDADQYTAVDEDLIPTGKLADVAGTPFDSRTSRPIEYLDKESGKPFHYDLNYALRSPSVPGQLHRGAELISSNGDLTMECWTDQPGIQFFDGAPMDLKNPGLGGAVNGYRAGLCLETQHWPDYIHHPHFAQSVIAPGETYTASTEYRFTRA